MVRAFMEFVWFIFVIIVFSIFWAWLHGAEGSSVCLTKKEARELWPRRHLYWYSSDHCWSNRRGPPRGIRIDPIDPAFPKKVMAKEFVVDDEEKPKSKWPRVAAEAIKPSIIYPSVRNPPNQIDRDLLKAVESTRSYRLLDIDELTGKRDQQLQECCWPELVYDANRNPIGLK